MNPERPERSAVPEASFPMGRSIIERIRSEVNDDMGPFVAPEETDMFRTLYLNERDGCVPPELLDADLSDSIHMMYYAVLDGVREELRLRVRPSDSLWVLVEASYEDATNFVLMTGEKVLLFGGSKAWHFYWESEDAMAEELEDWYSGAAQRLASGRSKVERSAEGRYEVTLQLVRKLDVVAGRAGDAYERALAWRSNEDDEQVRLLYEEVIAPPVGDGGDDPK